MITFEHIRTEIWGANASAGAIASAREGNGSWRD
jgi:hypothetical protein